MAICTFFLSNPSLHTKNNEIPIRIYKVLHIGPNAQFGGVQLGLDSAAYHVVICGRVETVPTAPAKNTMIIETINLGISLTLKFPDSTQTLHFQCIMYYIIIVLKDR